MTHVVHRNLRHPYPVAVGGEGVYLIDAEGRRYLDASGGAAVSCLGHRHPAVLAAMRAQLERLEFAPILIESHHIGPCYESRGRRADEDPEAYGRRTADELEAKILELGPRNVIAFVAETVAGATLGAVPAAPGYFRRIREICDRHGVL